MQVKGAPHSWHAHAAVVDSSDSWRIWHGLHRDHPALCTAFHLCGGCCCLLGRVLLPTTTGPAFYCADGLFRHNLSHINLYICVPFVQWGSQVFNVAVCVGVNRAPETETGGGGGGAGGGFWERGAMDRAIDQSPAEGPPHLFVVFVGGGGGGVYDGPTFFARFFSGFKAQYYFSVPQDALIPQMPYSSLSNSGVRMTFGVWGVDTSGICPPPPPPPSPSIGSDWRAVSAPFYPPPHVHCVSFVSCGASQCSGGFLPDSFGVTGHLSLGGRVCHVLGLVSVCEDIWTC